MTMGVSGPTTARIRRVVSMPSMSGIFQSIKQTSTSSPSLCARVTQSTASAPESAQRALICILLSNRAVCSHISRSSSTTSTFRALSASLLSASSSFSACWKASSTVNTVPCPGVLLTSIWPPIKLTRFWVMDMPSPVPPYCPEILASACSKGVYRWLSPSSSIPMPVSETLKRIRLQPSRGRSPCISRDTLPPGPVNLRALESRLSRIWLSRSESPIKVLPFSNPVIFSVKVSPLSCA